MIFCSVVNPAIDVVFSVDELKPGTTMIDNASLVLPAGKGINMAKAIHALGEKACVVGLIPLDDKRRFENYLQKIGIEYSFYEVEGSARICATIAEKNAMQVTHINSMSMNMSPRMQDEFMAFASGKMREGDIWAFAGSLPRGFDDDVYAKMIRTCARQKITALLDTRGKPLNLGVRAQPAIIKPNLSELEMLFNEPVQGVAHIALKGKRLIDMGIDYVFISLGQDGMIAIHESECLLCSPPRIDAVDTVGCGDALDAGVIVGLMRKFSFSEMCRMAVACGTSNALHPGAGNISKEEVWQLMEDVKIEAV